MRRERHQPRSPQGPQQNPSQNVPQDRPGHPPLSPRDHALRVAPLLAMLLGTLFLAACAGPGSDAGDGGPGTGNAGEAGAVVVYTSVDRQYSEPILDAFQKQTGVRVLPVYDVEAAKTTGLVQRLLAETVAPQADVWWNGEFAQTLQLADEGVFAPYRPAGAEALPEAFLDPQGRWTAWGGRARVFLVNRDEVPAGWRPRGLADLSDPDGAVPPERAGIAYPVFGTTATHVAALYALYGPEATRARFEAIRDAGVQIVDGNSVVRDQVLSGVLAYGLTDTDDACGALERAPDAPLELVFPDQADGEDGTLVVPNSAALVAGGPNPEQGQRLLDYLVSPETTAALVESGWFQVSLRDLGDVESCAPLGDLRTMDVPLADIAAYIQPAIEDMARVFVR